jgi:threonine dehydratase
MNQAWRPTTLIPATRLGRRLGVDLILASETFQHTGSFKFRATYHLASRIPNPLVIAASSGNFGQALAYACLLTGKKAIIVMPETSARVKVDAVREYGGQVEFVDVRSKSRAARVAELAAEHPEAYIGSAYDDPLVIEGNSSLGEELASLDVDSIVAPVGGGGLTSGIVTGLQRARSAEAPPTGDLQHDVRLKYRGVEVIGAEPLLGNDAARSLREGRIVANEHEPQTIADGARTVSLGKHNWPILRDGLARIVEVPEEKIARGVRLLFELANLKAEPTGALSIGALLTDPARFAGKSVCCVISGGNVDPGVYRELLEGE